MATADTRHAAWRSEFESLGEEGVRMMDSNSQTAPDDRIRFSRVWLKAREDARAEAREERMVAISERNAAIAESALSIAKDDLATAREQATWAKWAAVTAVIALIISKADAMSKLLP